MSLSEKSLQILRHTATRIREDIITMLRDAGSGHAAGSLGLADVFAVLYFHILKHDPRHPRWSERDRLFLSCGHVAPVLYATLAQAGYFPISELSTLRKLNSRLQGHPHRESLPGIETTTGPLGQGLSVAVGAALAAQRKRERHHVFCICSDGEQEEGMVWEALLCANKYKLNNLTIIIDRNNIQIGGSTEQILPLEPFADKYRAFGMLVREINGNDILECIDACARARKAIRPTVIIAHTTPGKGVSFMENDFRWHGMAPNAEQATEALRQLKAQDAALMNTHQ